PPRLEGRRVFGGRSARVGAGGRAAEAHKAALQKKPGFRRRQLPPADENALRCGKPLVIATPDDGDRDSGVDGGFQYSRARCRGDRPEWSVPFENEPGERVTLEVPADQREQVDAVLEIVVAPLRGVVGVLDYRHLGDGAAEQLARFILDRDRN